MMKSKKTILEYFDDTDNFIIPNYQRGYKWGVPDASKEGKCSVDVLMENLLQSFEKGEASYFLQGVTVSQTGRNVTLIDGQQRTTTLLLLLNLLGRNDLLIHNNGLKIKYEIRQETQKYLERLIGIHDLQTFDDVQDIYYLQKAHDNIANKLSKVDLNRDRFTTFLLNNVNILYIQIEESKATKTFTMMNGQKALMKPEELIKAELLRLISSSDGTSSSDKTTLTDEWEINSLRNKYAREWDKWLYWWNRKDVSGFFGTSRNMGLLVEYYFKINKPKDSQDGYSFENYKHFFLQKKISAKENFASLRKLQKSFEDLFNHTLSYNYLGLALACQSNARSKYNTIHFFLKNKSNYEELERYANWASIDCTHKQIKENDLTAYEEHRQHILNTLNSHNLYESAPQIANIQLLRKNVLLDNVLRRKFDFEIFGKKSLEHIHPQSWEKEKNTQLTFAEEDKEMHTVHCIGNLVLLDKGSNSKFSNYTFDEKKAIYFNTDNAIWSLKLLHSISIFSQSAWGVQSIVENKKNFINSFKQDFQIHG